MLVDSTDGVHDTKRVGEPPCIVMEVCDKSIKELMRKRHYPHFKPRTPGLLDNDAADAPARLFSEQEVVKVGLDVLNALIELHGVLKTYHGDISTKNIMRVRRGKYAINKPAAQHTPL